MCELGTTADHRHNDKEVVLRCREELNESQLRGVDVLECVDARVAEACLPGRSQSVVALEARHRPSDEIIEVDQAARPQQRLECGDGADRLFGCPSPLDLPRGELRIQQCSRGDRYGLRSAASGGATPCGAEERPQPSCHRVPRRRLPADHRGLIGLSCRGSVTLEISAPLVTRQPNPPTTTVTGA